jgi:predicted glycoside hydrolase/deacetylase ChbG (UPF0249 family)
VPGGVDQHRKQGPAAPAMRRIILCADDYGISPGVSAAIRDLIVRGRLNATSVMVAAPSFNRSEAAALRVLRSASRHLAIGLHVTLTAPFQPMSRSFRERHGDGFLPLEQTMRRAYARGFRRPPLMDEIATQLQAFMTAFGRPPDFIDGHQHVHLFPGVRQAALDVTRAQAPQAWIRQCGRALPLNRRFADRKGFLLDVLSLQFRQSAARRGVPTNPAFAGTYDFVPEADFAALFPAFLDHLPDGGLVMCHPGRVDAELTRLDPLTGLREREYDFLAGEAFPRLLAQHGVTLD